MNAEEVYQCGKCGLCLSVCPVYHVTREEGTSPRAKVQLIKHFSEKDLDSSLYLQELMRKCLMCGACTSFCPSCVDHESVFMRMRAEMADEFGDNWKLRLFFHLLSHNERLRFVSRFMHIGDGLVHKLRKSNLRDIPLKRLPQLNTKSFDRQVAATNPPQCALKGTVLYFTGCATRYFFDQIGWSTITVLNRLGYQVDVPKEQMCCGLPLFFHGHEGQALDNIRSTINIFAREDVDAVIVDCATCGAALRHEYAKVLSNLGQPTEKAELLSSKVCDVSEFVAKHVDDLLPVLAQSTEAAIQISYHSPCHLRNSQKVSQQIETMLHSLPGVEYVRASDCESCCGGGGTFFYEYPDITRTMVTKKIENARNTGASLWLTGCPGCRINLQGNMDEGEELTVQHPIEVVAKLLTGK